MDPQAQQQVVTQPPTSDAFVDPTQRKPGFSPITIFKNKLALLGVLLIVILVIIASLWLLNTQKQGNYEKALKNAQEAQSAYEKGDLATVQEKLLASYKVSPKDPKTQAALIKAIAVEGNLTGKEEEAFKKAEPYVNEALVTNRNSADVLLAVGYVNEIAGKYSEALAFYEEALGIDANNAEGLFHKGHVLEFLGRQQEAFEVYRKAYQLNDQDPLIAMSYAKVAVSEGKIEDAIALYKKTAQLSNIAAYQKAEALTNASVLRKGKAENLTEAIELSKQAVEADGSYAPALAEYGFNIGVYKGQAVDGISAMKKSIELNPRVSQTYWRLGAIYRLNNNSSEAIKYELLALDKVDSDNTIFGDRNRQIIKSSIAYDLATSYSMANQNSEILPILNLALQLNPSLKTQAKYDYENKFHFQGISTNTEFQNLLL